MHNYKLLVQYDGTQYAGWQIQKNARTIQEEISKAIKIILKEEINLIGSGRTDAGVHALGQTANFRTETAINLFRFKHQLNSILPKDISVIQIDETSLDFHARYDAKKRSYIYLFSLIKSPFLYRYSFFYHNKIECNSLNSLSKSLIGQNDFTSFSIKKCDTENKICNVYDISWKYTRDLIFFKIEADRYLHGMVRAIIGTLLYCSEKKYDEKFIEKIIAQKDREAAGESVPANGLFLFKVRY